MTSYTIKCICTYTFYAFFVTIVLSIIGDCGAGSLYKGMDTESKEIDPGSWILNTAYPASCSGNVTNWTFRLTSNDFSASSLLTFAVWEPEATDQYNMVSF